METFKVCISRYGYDHKPTPIDVQKMQFNQMTLSTDEFIQKIVEGHSYTALMKDNHRSKDNYICSNFIVYDIDHSPISINDYLNKVEIKPTFAYTTPSNKEGDYRYRLVYLLNFDLCSVDEYYHYSKSFKDQLKLNDVDYHSYEGEHYWNGSSGASVLVYNTILNKFNFKLNDNYNIRLTSKPTSSKSATQSIYCVSQQYSLTCTFEKDFFQMTYNDFLKKYLNVYPNIEKTPIEMNEDESIIYYPNDYYEITRDFYEKNGYIKKLKDGEGRRRRLFLNGIIRRKINPDITFENLIVNLVYEFDTYYINDGNAITQKVIYDIALGVMKADITNYSDLGKPKHKFFVNPLYRQKYNLSPKQVLGMTRNKKQYIGEFYDFSKTDIENLEIMKEYGLDISLRTLKTWKKENGITKYKKRG